MIVVVGTFIVCGCVITIDLVGNVTNDFVGKATIDLVVTGNETIDFVLDIGAAETTGI